MTVVPARRLDAVDAAILHLVRLVLDEGWTVAEAAAVLCQQVPDVAVLRRARVRVRRTLAERTGPAGQRAAATLDTALAALQSSGVEVVGHGRL